MYGWMDVFFAIYIRYILNKPNKYTLEGFSKTITDTELFLFSSVVILCYAVFLQYLHLDFCCCFYCI